MARTRSEKPPDAPATRTGLCILGVMVGVFTHMCCREYRQCLIQYKQTVIANVAIKEKHLYIYFHGLLT